MSYLDHRQSLRQRAASGGAVIAIQVGIGLALVTGLTISGFGPERERRVIGINIDDDPPPPPPPTPPAVETPTQTAMAPVPRIELTPVPAPQIEPLRPLEPTLSYVPTPPAPAPTLAPIPQPSPSFAPKRPVPLGNPGSWITTDDYPAAPLRRGIEGMAGYRLVIGSDGRVTACELTRSSGSAQLDDATCRYLTRRARFSPATDANGATTVGTWTGTVEWRIPE